MIITAFGERGAALLMQSRVILALILIRSSRVIPGLRGAPEVTTMTSELAVSA